MKEKIINWLIKVSQADTNKISDGYHTFEQLYEHRIELWIAYLNSLKSKSVAWKSHTHSDGSKWGGWFICGLNKKKGEQITYHLPVKYWKRLEVNTLPKAPPFDGHTPDDVIKRLQNL